MIQNNWKSIIKTLKRKHCQATLILQNFTTKYLFQISTLVAEKNAKSIHKFNLVGASGQVQAGHGCKTNE